MNPKQRLENFRKRWNIAFDDNKAFKEFKRCILEALVDSLEAFFLENREATKLFKRITAYHGGGRKKVRTSSGIFAIKENIVGRIECPFENHAVYDAIQRAKSLLDVVLYVQAVFWVLEKYPEKCAGFFSEVQEILKISAVPLRIAKSGTRVTLYPEGAKELDEGLVNNVLVWLKAYPRARENFENGLRLYMQKDNSGYEYVLNHLRKCLEILLRAVLSNRKPLEKQKPAINEWLITNGVNQEVANMYATLIDKFALYQNEHVKHQREMPKSKREDFCPEEVEFMIYLTGAFMRLVLSIQQRSSQKHES